MDILFNFVAHPYLTLSSHLQPSPQCYLPVFVCSLEMAKYTMQTASAGNPVDLNMSFSQSAPTVSTPTSMAVLAASTQAPNTINVHSPSTLPAIPTPQHYAVPVSSLLGMKTLPVLAVHPASGLPQGLSPYTAKIQTAGMKKSDRQKFAPY